MNEARLTIWDDAASKRLHEATLEVLAETGIEVRYAPGVELFAKAGAKVDGMRVRIPARRNSSPHQLPLRCLPRTGVREGVHVVSMASTGKAT